MSDPFGAGETLAGLASDLETGDTTSRDLVEACLARVEDGGGEGGRALPLVDRVGARRAAAQAVFGDRST